MFEAMRITLPSLIRTIGEEKARFLWSMQGKTPEDFFKALALLRIDPQVVLGALWSELPSFMTLTRGTIGTLFDSSGNFDTAAINEARFTHELYTGKRIGLLVEPQRENIIPHSTPNTGWNFISCINAGTIEVVPGKAAPGTKIQMSDVSGGNAAASVAVAATQNKILSCSIFVKGIGSSIGKRATLLLVEFPGASWGSLYNVTLTEQAQHIHVTSDVPATIGVLALLGVGNFNAFGGDSNLENGDQIGLDLCMLEHGEPTSGIETAGVALTRDADVVTFTDTSKDVEVVYIPLGESAPTRVVVAAGNQPSGLYGTWLRARQL